jgi:hypothetical protein
LQYKIKVLAILEESVNAAPRTLEVKRGKKGYQVHPSTLPGHRLFPWEK